MQSWGFPPRCLAMERNLPLRVMPFYTGVYKAVDDPSSDSIISWSSNNRSFIIWDHREFERKIISTCGDLEELWDLRTA
ncbi:unnamed protein product [Thlaspi arvense]|uniref:HSF-type DNA-binding domain-containing protein n=1 Tax=Thlaspi arvense TaxID=13288 RepID=A0AAU9T344_THLAR|nr:unnamed protein product [Thlaspi arvense]